MSVISAAEIKENRTKEYFLATIKDEIIKAAL